MHKKIWKAVCIILAVIIVAAVFFLIALWRMFGEKVTAAKSVVSLDEGLYYMEYKGDYGFDEFLNRGGAVSDAEMGEYIVEFLSNGFYKAETAAAEKNFGCSTLCMEAASGAQLMGRNFDWQECSAMIVHTVPDSGYESISTCNLDFLGFGEGWKPEGMQNQYMALAAIYVPLDGMNEKGLCVADLISGDDAETHQDFGNPDLTTVSAIRLLLDKAASVDEAIALLSQYDMNSSIGTSHHLAVSDAEGRSVVIEYIDNEMVVTDTPAVTNHYLSPGEKFGVGNEESHRRYDTLIEMRRQADGVMEPEALKSSMENVSYEDETQWSIVYDKRNLTIDFYWRRQYDKPYHYDVNQK
ncbi:MAG: C45 family peptidase [Eubacteriales bacterium]|nr:C45 family peptidase [Eubacteriales bacterium]